MQRIGFFTDDKLKRTGEAVTKLFTVMGNIGFRLASRRQLQENRFHHVALSVGDDPPDVLPLLLVLFRKKVLFAKNDLFFFIVAEKFLEIGPQALQNINQRCDGRGGQIIFQLRNKSFGELTAVGKLLLRQLVQNPKLTDFFSDFRITDSFPDRDPK